MSSCHLYVIVFFRLFLYSGSRYMFQLHMELSKYDVYKLEKVNFT